MEVESSNIFSNCENQGNSTYGSICFTTKPSITKIHFLMPDPGSQFPSTALEKSLWVCIPFTLLNRRGNCQSKEGPVSLSYHDTSMTNSVIVCNITVNVSSASNNSTQSNHVVTRHSRIKTPSAKRQPTTVGGMEGFKKVLEDGRVSEVAATLITNSRRSGLISNYQSAWQIWASWRYQREVDPFTRNLIEILNSLTSLFQKGYKYSCINSHRSAISAPYRYYLYEHNKCT